MKVATWNVNGIRARQAQLLEWIDEERPDVVCLQEIKASPAQVPESCGLPDYWCYWHGMGGYSGVGLHLRRSAFGEEPQFSHPSFDRETRVVQAKAGDTTFISVYVPNGGKDYPGKIEFLHALEKYVGEVRERGEKLVLCGDINIARTEIDIHPKEKKPNIVGTRPEERELFERILETGDLVDVQRSLHPDDENLFTWWAPWRNLRQRNIGWRIDYILASESIARTAVECQVQREVGTSDHGPVIAVFG